MSDDYEPAIGTESMVDAEEPGARPAVIRRANRDDDRPDGEAAERWGSEGSAGAPIIESSSRRNARINHRIKTPEQQKAFDDLVAARKAEKARPQDPDADGDEDDWAPADPTKPVTIEQRREPEYEQRREAKPAEPESEVVALRRRLEQLETRVAPPRERELDVPRTQPKAEEPDSTSFADFERYLDSPDKTTRAWFEHMTGSKMTDDEYRQEVADHVTLLTERVLNVKLPDEVKARIETAMTKKALGAYKLNNTRREQAEADRRAKEEADSKWSEAGQTLSQEFTTRPDLKEKYGHLSRVKDPGKIVVQAMREAMSRDGTRLKWDEAAKLANQNIKEAVDAFKDLYGASPERVAPNTPQPSNDVRQGRPQEPVVRSSEARMPVIPRGEPSLKYDARAHRRATLRAFAPQIAGLKDSPK